MEHTENEMNSDRPDMQEVEAARKEIEALRRDIETLRGDLRSLYQSAKGASKVTLDDAKSRVQETAKNVETWATTFYGNTQDQTQRLIEAGRQSILKRPFTTVAGAVLAGMIVGRMRGKS